MIKYGHKWLNIIVLHAWVKLLIVEYWQHTIFMLGTISF